MNLAAIRWAVAQRRPWSAIELARALGVTPRTGYRTVERLANAGLIIDVCDEGAALWESCLVWRAP